MRNRDFTSGSDNDDGVSAEDVNIDWESIGDDSGSQSSEGSSSSSSSTSSTSSDRYQGRRSPSPPPEPGPDTQSQPSSEPSTEYSDPGTATAQAVTTRVEELEEKLTSGGGSSRSDGGSSTTNSTDRDATDSDTSTQSRSTSSSQASSTGGGSPSQSQSPPEPGVDTDQMMADRTGGLTPGRSRGQPSQTEMTKDERVSRQATAAMQREGVSVGQGVESGDSRTSQQAQNLEQQVLDRYPGVDDPAHVRVNRQGDQLTAELTAGGRNARREYQRTLGQGSPATGPGSRAQAEAFLQESGEMAVEVSTAEQSDVYDVTDIEAERTGDGGYDVRATDQAIREQVAEENPGVSPDEVVVQRENGGVQVSRAQPDPYRGDPTGQTQANITDYNRSRGPGSPRGEESGSSDVQYTEEQLEEAGVDMDAYSTDGSSNQRVVTADEAIDTGPRPADSTRVDLGAAPGGSSLINDGRVNHEVAGIDLVGVGARTIELVDYGLGDTDEAVARAGEDISSGNYAAAADDLTGDFDKSVDQIVEVIGDRRTGSEVEGNYQQSFNRGDYSGAAAALGNQIAADYEVAAGIGDALAGSTDEYVGSAEADSDIVRDMTSGGVLSEEQEQSLEGYANWYSEFGRGVGRGVAIPITVGESAYQMYQGRNPDQEGLAQRFAESGVATVFGLGNIPSHLRKGETAIEVLENTPDAVMEEGPGAVAETATAVTARKGDQIYEYAQENPAAFAGSLAGALYSGHLVGRFSPVRYQRGRIPDGEGSTVYRGVTYSRPGSSDVRPLVGATGSIPTPRLGTSVSVNSGVSASVRSPITGGIEGPRADIDIETPTADIEAKPKSRDTETTEERIVGRTNRPQGPEGADVETQAGSVYTEFEGPSANVGTQRPVDVEVGRPSLDVSLGRPSFEMPNRMISPTLGTPEVDVTGPRMGPDTEGYAPSGQLETSIVDTNLRRQLEGDDLQRYEAAMQLQSLGNRGLVQRVGDRLRRSETRTPVDEGVREARQIPDEAAGEVADWIRNEDVMLGGSAAQLMQARRARTPDDIDIYTRDPDAAQEELYNILEPYESRPMRQRNGIEVMTEDGWDHMVDINEMSRGVSGQKDWGGELYGSTRASEGGRIQPLESQMSAKVEGAVRVFEGGTVAPKTWRSKDVTDVADVSRGLIDRGKRSINPLEQYRARRAESALEDFEESFGTMDLPGESYAGWGDFRRGFETTEMTTAAGSGGSGVMGRVPDVTERMPQMNFELRAAGLGRDNRGQTTLAGQATHRGEDTEGPSRTETARQPAGSEQERQASRMGEGRQRDGETPRRSRDTEQRQPQDRGDGNRRPRDRDIEQEYRNAGRKYRDRDYYPRTGDRDTRYSYGGTGREDYRYGGPGDDREDYGPTTGGSEDYGPTGGDDGEYGPPTGEDNQYTPPVDDVGYDFPRVTYGPPSYGSSTPVGGPADYTTYDTSGIPANPVVQRQSQRRTEIWDNEEKEEAKRMVDMGYYGKGWVNPVADAQQATQAILGGSGDYGLGAVEEDLQNLR